MLALKSLHERNFAGKALKNFRVYNDPFGEHEVCIELIFLDGQVEYVAIGPGRPEIVSCARCYEDGLVQQAPDARHGLTLSEDRERRDVRVSSSAM